MTRNRIVILAAVFVLVAGGAVLWLSRKAASGAEAADASPTASVTTASVRSETLKDVASVYGVVQADPAATTMIAAPRAVIVARILVRAGEVVTAGQALAEMVSAPGADLAYRQAADAASFARNDLARVQRLFDGHLAASDQLGAAKKTLADAEAALAAQEKQGGGRARQTLTASAASVVTNIAVAPGDHVAQDAPLMTLVRKGALSAKLGLEPTAGRFAAGQAVTIRPTAGGVPIASRLAMVGRSADPASKTLDAIAPLGDGAPPIGSAVEAEVTTGAHKGLAAPRAAVVFDETGAHVFVIAGGKARRVFVTVGHDFGDEIEVRGPLNAGQAVAVQGAYELQDGMAVKVSGR
jgi:RND family efflux transporter MFP subunit